MPTSAVDPLQWWSALTKQFAELAANAMQSPAAEATKSMAGNMMKQSIEAAAQRLQGGAGANEDKAGRNGSGSGDRGERAGAGRASGRAAPARKAAAKKSAAKKSAAARKRAAPPAVE